jgi:sarcosine oxidase subunit alpha
VWEALMAAGAEFDITPYGTETMHVLRAEKGYIIVGQDTDGSVTPYDLGMGGLVAKSKDFLGKRSLSRADTSKEGRKQFVGLLTADDQLVLPEGAQIIAKDTQVSAAEPTPMIGHVTSSYYSPILKRSIALAVVKGGLNKMGESRDSAGRRQAHHRDDFEPGFLRYRRGAPACGMKPETRRRWQARASRLNRRSSARPMC